MMKFSLSLVCCVSKGQCLKAKYENEHLTPALSPFCYRKTRRGGNAPSVFRNRATCRAEPQARTVSGCTPKWGVRLDTVLNLTRQGVEFAGGHGCAATMSARAAGIWRVARSSAHERFRRPCASLGVGMVAARPLPPAKDSDEMHTEMGRFQFPLARGRAVVTITRRFIRHVRRVFLF